MNERVKHVATNATGTVTGTTKFRGWLIITWDDGTSTYTRPESVKPLHEKVSA